MLMYTLYITIMKPLLYLHAHAMLCNSSRGGGKAEVPVNNGGRGGGYTIQYGLWWFKWSFCVTDILVQKIPSLFP